MLRTPLNLGLLLLLCAGGATALAPAEETEALCGGLWARCLERKCCATPELTCYEKDRWFAQCRPTGNCRPGFYEGDPHKSPWSCVVLSSPAPAPGPGPGPGPGPAPPPPQQCVDKGQHCVDWAMAGECEKNAAYMHEFCMNSCNLCGNLFTNSPEGTAAAPAAAPAAAGDSSSNHVAGSRNATDSSLRGGR